MECLGLPSPSMANKPQNANISGPYFSIRGVCTFSESGVLDF